jgi:hypothetical protein
VERLRGFSARELYVERPPRLRLVLSKQDFVSIGIGCTGGGDGSLPRAGAALVAALRASGGLPDPCPSSR